MIIPYGHQNISEEDIKEASKALRSDWVTQGPEIEKFEKAFAKYCGAKYAVAVSSGTAALHIAYLAAGFKNGDEVITTPNTFAATANMIVACGAKPVFCDISKETLNIDEDKISRLINKNTKAIVPVHFAGLPCQMQKIAEIAKKNRLIVIEDACHALGAEYNRKKIGSCQYSDMAVFSFHPVKHITTGEGGMVATNSEAIYEKLKMLRNHGNTKEQKFLQKKDQGGWYYEMQELGFNYRITDFQCALGSSQLKKLDGFVSERRKIAEKYHFALKNLPLETIKEITGKNSYHLFVILVRDEKTRLALYNYLREKEIFCQVHYIPVYWHPFYKKLGYKEGLCLNSEDVYKRILSIPIYPGVDAKIQGRVVAEISKFFANEKK